MATSATAGVVIGISPFSSYSQTFLVTDYPGAGFAALTGAVFSDFEAGDRGSVLIRSNVMSGSGSTIVEAVFSGYESVGLASATSFTVSFFPSSGNFTLESFDLTVGTQRISITPNSPVTGTVPEPATMLLVGLACCAAGATTRSRRQVLQA